MYHYSVRPQALVPSIQPYYSPPLGTSNRKSSIHAQCTRSVACAQDLKERRNEILMKAKEGGASFIPGDDREVWIQRLSDG